MAAQICMRQGSMLPQIPLSSVLCPFAPNRCKFLTPILQPASPRRYPAYLHDDACNYGIVDHDPIMVRSEGLLVIAAKP